MPWKMLTAITTITTQYATQTLITTAQAEIEATARAFATEHAIKLTTTTALRFLDVQKLMITMKALETSRLLPIITLPERTTRATALAQPLLEEEELAKKKLIPTKQLEEQKTIRKQYTRLEKRLIEITERLLSPTAINLIDHQSFCMLESLLWTTIQEEMKLCIEQMLMSTIAKRPYVERIAGLEHLQKLLLQTYIPMFMGTPSMTNIIALRLTALTRQLLKGMNAEIYMTATHQAEAMKPKMAPTPAQKRKLITKAVASGKKRTEWVPRKEEIGVTEELTDETKVSVGKDAYGKDMFFTALRYAYSMPYWMRRWLARSYGMPENHKYARYFGIGCIPIRRSLTGYRKRRYTQEAWTYFNRDEYIKLIKKYGSRYRAGYSHF